MTFGRPRMISLNTQVSLPLPVDDEYICDGSTICEQPNEQFSRLQFFISTSKLYAILGEILKIFYDASGSTGASSEGRKAENYYQSIMRLDRQLLNFQAELPAPLKLRGDSNSSPARDPVVFRQANVLLSR